MRSEEEIRAKLESVDDHWNNINDIIDHGGANPVVGAVCLTMKWVLEEHPDIDD